MRKVNTKFGKSLQKREYENKYEKVILSIEKIIINIEKKIFGNHLQVSQIYFL